MNRRLTASLTAAAALLYAGPAAAFSEDLCARSSADRSVTWITDCMQSATCAPGSSNTGACYVNVMWDAGQATARGNGRSMLHMDSTYILAQAVGFRWDIAYWLAAYDEVTDLGEYVPFDRCGARLTDETLWAEPINGFQRTDASHGGFGYHFVTAFSQTGNGRDLAGVTGLYPDVSDTLHEGMLSHLRRWAYEGAPGASTAPMCTNGFTARAPSSAAPYMNRACYDPLPGTGSQLIRGEVPLFTPGGTRAPFAAYNGDQYLMTSASGATLYFDALDAVLQGGSGTLQAGADAGQPVPSVLARAGIYLHVLQDRISHHKCGDVSYVRQGGAGYQYLYEPIGDPVQCTQDQHAWGHYQEIGQPTLPERTYAGLEYTYDELRALATTLRAARPGWFTARYGSPIARAALIRDASGAAGGLSQVLMVPGGASRVAAEMALVAGYGLHPLPGHDSATVCR